MGSLGPLELFIIFLVILLVFGAKRIPEIARGLGKGIREFKSATKEISDEFNTEDTSRIESRRAPQATQPRKSQYEPEAEEARRPYESDQPMREAVKREAKEKEGERAGD